MSRILLRFLLLAAILIPLIFLPQLYDIYDLSKATYLRILSVLFVALWLLDAAIVGRLEFPRSVLIAPVAILAILMLLSTIFALNPVIATAGALKRHEGWTTYISYFLIMFGAASCFRRKDQNVIGGVFAVVTILISSYGIAQRYGLDFMNFGQGISYDLTRAFATTGNPVFLGTLTSLAVPFFAVLMLQPALGHPKRILYGTAAGLSLVACVFTYSRGAWLGILAALVFGLPLLIHLFGWRPLLERWKTVLAVAGLILLIMFSTAIFKPQSSQFSSSIKERAAASLNTSEGSVGTRLEMWKSTLGLIESTPLLGVGLENFRSVFPKYRSLELIKLEGEFAMPDRPHNELLYIASSMGLVGLTAFIWIFLAALLLMIRWARRKNWSRDHVPARWMLAAIAVAVVSNLVAELTSFTTINTTTLVWLLLGFAIVLGSRRSSAKVTYELPRVGAIVRIPLYVLLVVGVGFFVQYAARFPVGDYYYNEARFARYYGDFDKAQRLAVSAIRMNPYQNLYRIELAGIYTDERTRTGDLSWTGRALDVYQDAVLFDRYDMDSWANMGNAYLDLAQAQNTGYLKNAEAAYRKSLEIDPHFSIAHLQLGSIYSANRRPLDAAKEFRAAMKVSGETVETLGFLAGAYLESGNEAEAIKAYNRILKLEPKNEDAQKALKTIRGKKEAS